MRLGFGAEAFNTNFLPHDAKEVLQNLNCGKEQGTVDLRQSLMLNCVS